MGRLILLPNHLWGLLVIGIFCVSLVPTYARNTKDMILIDGRSTAEQFGDNGNLDMSGLSLGNIEHIEVIKGSASSLYDSNVLYGLIDPTSRMRGVVDSAAIC